MPHSFRESHLEELCVNCKKPHGNQIELHHVHHKIYEVIHCMNCNYEIWKSRPEPGFTDRFTLR